MKKRYETPLVDCAILNAEDILTVSGDFDNVVEIPSLPGWPGKL